MNIKQIIPLLLLFTCSFYAQENIKDKKEQIQSLKMAFITNELNLSSQEAEKFWPIYNAYDNKQFELRHQKMKTYKSKMHDDALDKISEKDAAILLAQMDATDEELFYLRKKFNKSIRTILPASKVLKLKKAEDNFNRKLLQQYGDRGRRK